MNQFFQEWILKNAENVNLRIDDLYWIEGYYNGIFDIHVEISVNENVSEGRGHANSKDIALQKAVSEAIERAVCLTHLETTNGVASHLTLELAKKNALNELIERDLFLSHFLTKTPFHPDRSLTNALPKSILGEVKKNGDSINVFRTRPTSLGQGLICLITGSQKWGGIIGMSFGNGDEHHLVTKATLEAFRHYWHRKSRGSLTDCLPLESFMNRSSWTYIENGDLGLDPEYFSKIMHLFPAEASSYKGHLIDYSNTNFQFRDLPIEQIDLQDCPLKIVHCTSKEIQQLVPGPYNEKNVSKKGLERFLNGQLFSIETLPHPIS